MPTARLEHLPVTLFSTVMGIAGLSLAWRRAAHTWEVPEWPAQLLFWVAAAVFVLIAALYASKWVKHPRAARAELHHPIRMTFAPTITIALLLLATAAQDLLPALASTLWWVGAVGHLVATVVVMSAWFARSDIGVDQMTPAWFIPVVGNLVTPLAAPTIGSVELGWFAFGAGLVLWIALLPLLLQRVLIHERVLPVKLLPTLAIFLAPPAVAMLSWQSLTGDADGPFPRILYATAMVFTAFLLAQFARLHRVPFALPYWAYTFPMAAATTAAISMAAARSQTAYDVVALALLAGTTVLAVLVSALTVRAAARGQICVPE
ncbi:SLAC1 anion channel family protein [Intrasporangium sp.]|uniref:SLAC1 anion channel family protein n=1 Tax=Intrasporangium sp. TaxID=1925024 RepID=UPI00293B4381|nr:SLAC1 anion channel family protein [Intrasporangium sp.]MDV3222203.1 SLAC1 anion channel family protein [Intrasporangium sp.]